MSRRRFDETFKRSREKLFRSMRLEESLVIVQVKSMELMLNVYEVGVGCINSMEKIVLQMNIPTAFVQMEDGINGYGLAIGLTSIYLVSIKYGINAQL